MKRFKNIFALLAFVLCLNACTEAILDKQPLDTITESNLWASSSLVKTYINGIYKDLPILYCDNDYDMGGAPWFSTEVLQMDDQCSPNWPTHSVPKYGEMNSTSKFKSWWGYGAIRKMNVLIDELPNASAINENDKAAYLAETRYLRAYAYFHMAKLFGGVPIIKKAQVLSDPEGELYPARNTEEEVYNFILSELDEIVNDLPSEVPTSEFGRPTKITALALKSRAALYAASIAQWGTVQGPVGISSSKASSYWQTSYNASKSIIDYSVANSGKLSLYNKIPDKAQNYRQIFLEDRNVEVIWAKPFMGEMGGSYEGDVNFWNMDNSPRNLHPWVGGHDCAIYLEMIDEYENADGTSGVLDRSKLASGLFTIDELFGKKEPRFFGSVYTENTDYYGRRVRMYNGVIGEDGALVTSGVYKDISVHPNTHVGADAFGVLKYCTGSLWPQPTDYILFRYAEVLLNFAEAAFELGKTAEALSAINQIRERAGVPILSNIDREKIRRERKVELAYENHQYWDLRRWRTAVEKLSKQFTTLQFNLDYASYAIDPTNAKYKVNVVPADLGKACVFTQKNYYFPITPERISNNKNLVENPGY